MSPEAIDRYLDGLVAVGILPGRFTDSKDKNPVKLDWVTDLRGKGILPPEGKSWNDPREKTLSPTQPEIKKLPAEPVAAAIQPLGPPQEQAHTGTGHGV